MVVKPDGEDGEAGGGRRRKLKILPGQSSKSDHGNGSGRRKLTFVKKGEGKNKNEGSKRSLQVRKQKSGASKRLVRVAGKNRKQVIGSRSGSEDEDEDSPSAKRARADDDEEDDAREREDDDDDEVPLYMCLGQLKCARGGCVPCRRAVFAAAGAQNAPNARPETCPRYARDAREVSVKRMGLYRSGRRRLLTVGDGDFSFSLALARAFGGDGVVATSYETRESLESVYGESCARTLEALAETGATVAHGVDASALDETLPEKCRGEKYDCVVWNFPCVARAADGTATEAALNGFDARSAEELEANRALVESFVSGASSYLVPEKGEIHITHKVGMQCDWSISKAASSCRSSELTCAGAVVFDRMSYPAYKPRKALVAKSFPVTDARTFVFTNSPDGTAETLDPSTKLVSRVAKS